MCYATFIQNDTLSFMPKLLPFDGLHIVIQTRYSQVCGQRGQGWNRRWNDISERQVFVTIDSIGHCKISARFDVFCLYLFKLVYNLLNYWILKSVSMLIQNGIFVAK